MPHDPLFNITLCFHSTVLLCTLLAILSIVWSSSKSALGGVVDQLKVNKILETKIASSLTPIIAGPNTQAATGDDDNDKHHQHEDPSSSTAGGSIRKSSQKERHDDDQGDVNEEIDSNETVSVTMMDVPAAGVILIDASSPINTDDAINFVLARKQIYDDQKRLFTWWMRGIGYLYEQHGVVLAGKYIYVTGRKTHSVHIHNTQENKVNCSDIVIWVRVNGPKEIFAGQAQAIHTPVNTGMPSNDHYINDECHWEFDFDARSSGSYNIDAKLMEWKPHVPRPQQCPVVTTNATIVEPYPVRKSFLGFKMYKPEEMCCEICSRLAGHCKAWATPIPAFPMGAIQKHKARRGCELYFENELMVLGVPPVSPMIAKLNETGQAQFDIPVKQHSKKSYGLPHHNDTSHFLGCGWSYWFTLDYPCISGALDDNIFFANNSMNLTDAVLSVEIDETKAVALIGQESDGDNASLIEPLCSAESESFENHSGRWVREPWPTEEECPRPFEILKVYGNDSNPNCFRRDNLSVHDQRCIEINCELIQTESLWVSPLHREKQWSGHWKHDSGCKYSQYTNIELQQCIDRRKLYGFKVKGHSIASMVNGALSKRFENITFYNNDLGDGTKVKLSTYSLLHYCHNPQGVKDYFENQAPNVAENEEFLWVSGFFLSSEREILCTSSRMRQYSIWGDQYLTPKGYKMINAYDMTAAMTYDTAAQHDGMHIEGPPLAMILTKIFHYLCAGQ